MPVSLLDILLFARQILFKKGDIRDFYNKPDEPMIVPEDGSFRQLTLW